MITSVKTYICKKKHKSGNVIWIVRWKEAATGRWLSLVGGKSKGEAQIIEARVREMLLKGEDPRPHRANVGSNRPLSNPTVAEIVSQFFLNSRFLTLRPGWKQMVERQIVTKILPSLGKVRWTQLRKETLL